MDLGDEGKRRGLGARLRRHSTFLAVAGLIVCALLGVAANALPESVQRVGFSAVGVLLGFSAWFLLVLAQPRGRSLLTELGNCVAPALFGGLLVSVATFFGQRQLDGVRTLTQHLWIHPGLAAFLSGATAAGMITFLARAALAPRPPGARESSRE